MDTNPSLKYMAEHVEQMQKDFDKQNKNIPSTGSWKGVGVNRDENGNILPVHQSKGPNRRERRLEKQPLSKRNRKNTAGRTTQTAPVMQVVDKTEYGDIKLPTGYQRKIHHNKVQSKVQSEYNKHKMKAYEARNPMPAEKKGEPGDTDNKE